MTGRIVLKTPRLEIFPVTRDELALLIADIRLLEERLGLAVGEDVFGAEFILAMRWLLLQQQDHAGENPWLTYWQIVARDGPVGIGGACFKGGPDDGGSVEIGYGILDGFKRQGYMTEAVGAICAWALGQPGVRRVVAETESTNTASRRVLLNCGFEPVAEQDGIITWHLSRGNGTRI